MIITLIFSRSHKLSSALIRFGTWSSFSHVEAEIDGALIGAQLNGGVVITDIDARGAKSSLVGVYMIECSKEQLQKFSDFMRSQIGKPYDWRAIIGMPFRRDVEDPSSWFCSELIASAAFSAGITLVRKGMHRVTPQDIWESPRGDQIKVYRANE